MADRVVIHVGAPKSGTTYLQSILWANQSALREAGLLLPGSTMFDHNLLSTYVRSERPGRRAVRAWQRMVEGVNAWPGTAVLSNEWFSLANEQQAAQALDAFARAEMHVVCTARDFVSIAPAAWQERLKLGHAVSLGDFIASLEAPEARWSWWTLDPATVLERWGAALPVAQVHVVTVPSSAGQPDLLWERFAGTCKIPPGACDLSRSTANESLGAESARLLQLLGPRLRNTIDADKSEWTAQYRWLRRYVGHELLVPRGGSKIALREDDAATLRLRSGQSIDRLKAAGYDVAGDLCELVPANAAPSAVHPDEVSDAALLEVASDLVVDLLRRVRDEAHRADRAERR